MSDTRKYFWCAYLQAVTAMLDWPFQCPLCDRYVDADLSTHHDLFDDVALIPWGNF